MEVAGRRHSLKRTFTFFTCADLYLEQQSYSFIINLNQSQENLQRSHSSGFKDLCVRNNPLKSIKFIFSGLMIVSWSNRQETQSIQFYVLSCHLDGHHHNKKDSNKVSLCPVISQYVCFLHLHS